MSVEEQIKLIEQQMALTSTNNRRVVYDAETMNNPQLDRNFIGYNQINSQPNIDVTPRQTITSSSYQVASDATNNTFHLSAGTGGQYITIRSDGTPEWTDLIYQDAQPKKKKKPAPTSSLQDFIVDSQGGWMIPESKKQPEKYNFFTSLKLTNG